MAWRQYEDKVDVFFLKEFYWVLIGPAIIFLSIDYFIANDDNRSYLWIPLLLILMGLIGVGFMSKWSAYTEGQNKLRYHGLTCHKCKTIASALPNTGNKYRCDNCGHQFSGSRHGF